MGILRFSEGVRSEICERMRRINQRSLGACEIANWFDIPLRVVSLVAVALDVSGVDHESADGCLDCQTMRGSPGGTTNNSYIIQYDSTSVSATQGGA